VRIAWITAILVCAVAILIGLFSGTDGGDSSQQLPGFAFSEAGDSSQQSSESALPDPAAAGVGAAAQEDRSGWAKDGAPKDSRFASGVPGLPGTQPEDTGDRTPVATPRPKGQQAPAGDPAEAPQAPSVDPPKPPPTPPVAPPKPPPPPPVTTPDPPPVPPVTPPEPPVIPAP
jgi:hypothetical protein